MVSGSSAMAMDPTCPSPVSNATLARFHNSRDCSLALFCRLVRFITDTFGRPRGVVERRPCEDGPMPPLPLIISVVMILSNPNPSRRDRGCLTKGGMRVGVLQCGHRGWSGLGVGV